MTPAGDGVFTVGLRSALIRDGVAHAYAGAGIVAESEPQSEWVETDLKLQTIIEALSYRELA